MLKSLPLKHFQVSLHAVDRLACVNSVFLSCVSVRERKGGESFSLDIPSGKQDSSTYSVLGVDQQPSFIGS